MKTQSLAFFLLCSILFGCATVSTPAPLSVRRRIIFYEKPRIGVLEFSSPFNDKGYGKMFSEMMMKALRKTNRFLTVEVAGFEGKIEKAGDKYLDMFVSGTIRTAGNEPCAEVRLVNAQDHEIMSAFSPCGLSELDTTVSAISKLFLKEGDSPGEAGDSAKKRGGIKLGLVESVDDKLLVINLGSKNLIKRGMVASVHAKGEYVEAQNVPLRKLIQDYSGRAKSISTHFSNDVVGSVYIVSVEPEYSIGVFYGGDYAQPGDEVEFK